MLKMRRARKVREGFIRHHRIERAMCSVNRESCGVRELAPAVLRHHREQREQAPALQVPGSGGVWRPLPIGGFWARVRVCRVTYSNPCVPPRLRGTGSSTNLWHPLAKFHDTRSHEPTPIVVTRANFLGREHTSHRLHRPASTAGVWRRRGCPARRTPEAAGMASRRNVRSRAGQSLAIGLTVPERESATAPRSS